ncbi:MAG: LLM class flavin-dependent oxidoreductase [Acidimicrobiia bacterium]|nr:LLM class flavin-dependent oxidoreductase [Acidimicrobiia bacterium]
MTQLFGQTVARPDSGDQARRAEERGWDGLSFVDSQNLSGDVYVAMTTAASATERLFVSTGVTNPVTRHPAVTAGAVASVQAVSGGRAVLALGRGDSALAHLGRAPARVGDFERYLVAVQAYLRGDGIPFDELGFGEAVAPPVDELELAATAGTSSIVWLPSRHPKVPVEVAATGPRVIAAAARNADRVLFALGADPERVRWGIDVARQARRAAGLDPAGVAFGAFVNVVCLPNVTAARELARGGLSTFARFSVMHGDVVGPVSDEQAEVMHRLHDDYDMRSHTRSDSAQAEVLTDDFVDAYAVVGPPEHCIERLRSLAALGLDKLVVVGATMGANRDAAAEADEMIAQHVLGEVGS